MAGREPRSAARACKAGSRRAGPLAGWAWREARRAMQLGRRQGAYGVELRQDNVRFLFDRNTPAVVERRAVEQRPAPAGQAAPQRRRNTATSSAEPPAALSKRKQRSLARLQEFQRLQRVKKLWRRALHKVVKMMRHQRLWRVHNAWIAAQPAPAEAAGQPAPASSGRMDVDDSANRADEPRAEQPGEHAAGGLRVDATEFAPGLPMAEVVSAWQEVVKLAAGRWQVSWHDLANVLTRRSESALEKRPWHPWPGGEAGDHRARPRERDVCPSGDVDSDSDPCGGPFSDSD